MVLANVAAAEELERLRRSCMYRVHAPPSEEKLANLRTFLGNAGYRPWRPAGRSTPGDLDRVLKKVAGTEHAPMVNEVMLRSQSQAAYSAGQYRPFRIVAAALCAFHQPHPALRGSAGAPRADRRPQARPGRAVGRGGARASRMPPNTSPPPNAAPPWRSVRRWTVTLLHTWRIKWGRRSRRAYPA